MSQTVALCLLDGPTGRALQKWTFDDRSVIRIGRSPENDVVIADQFVSRDHVCLSLDGGTWVLTVLSQQGVFCGSRKVFNLRLGPEAANGFLFRLGSNGPHLRFELVSEGELDESTVYHDAGQQPILRLDRERLRREVGEICDGDFFQKLRASIGALRGDAEESPGGGG